jgi:hypothetical protein
MKKKLGLKRVFLDRDKYPKIFLKFLEDLAEKTFYFSLSTVTKSFKEIKQKNFLDIYPGPKTPIFRLKILPDTMLPWSLLVRIKKFKFATFTNLYITCIIRIAKNLRRLSNFKPSITFTFENCIDQMTFHIHAIFDVFLCETKNKNRFN